MRPKYTVFGIQYFSYEMIESESTYAKPIFISDENSSISYNQCTLMKIGINIQY